MSSVVTPVRMRFGGSDRSRTRPFSLLGISLGYFMVLLDMTVLSVAEPDLARSLGGSVAGLQWVVTGYTVVFGALLLSAGAVADRFGAHRAFRVGIAAFGLGSLLSALAPDLWTLVALRAVLGIAAAACVPASMAMITGLYPEPAERAKAIAVWAAISGAALATGPIAGGLLVDLAGWRSIFLINAPLAAVTLALTAGRSVHCPRSDRAIDWATQLVACAGLGLGTDALIAFGSGSVSHASWSAAGTIAAGTVFTALERRSANPVLVPAMLRGRGMRPALLAGAAVNFTMTGVLFVLPLLFQQTLHLSSLETGMAFLPMTLPFAFNPLLTGRIVAKTGPRSPVLTGLGLLTAGGLVLGGAVLTGSALPLPKTSSGLVGAGVPHVGRPSAGCWLWALRSWVIDAAGWFAVLLRLAYLGVTNAFAVLRLLPMSNRDKDVEILALRHQITVLERHLGKERVRFDTSDRALLAALLHRLPSDVLRSVRLLVRPDTVLRWHRDLVARRHAAVSRSKRPGRPADRAFRPQPGAAPGAGESELGVPAHPRGTARPRGEGGRIHGVGDLEGGRDRPRTRAGLQHLGRLPALPGRRPAGMRLPGDRHPHGSADVRLGSVESEHRRRRAFNAAVTCEDFHRT
jgi:MFS transporter, DHA2 family, methylenomycin A resistance protein